MTKKMKQVGFLTAIIISVGSTIGAGIFFKNGSIFSNAHGSLAFMVASWIVAAVGVMALGIALIEISSGTKSDAGIAEYTMKFTKKGFAKFSSSYMIFVSLPVNYISLPLYAASALQDAVQTVHPQSTMSGWEVLGIAFGFAVWIVSVSFFSQKFAIKTQFIYTAIKFLPLIIAPFFAMVYAGQNGVLTSIPKDAYSNPVGFVSLSPWLGILASIPAILFAFDGFYTVTSVQSHLKDKKKMGVIVSLSLSTITAAYLFFGISTGMAGATNVMNIKNVPKELKTLFNICIMSAIMGIINGFAIATPKVFEETYHEQAFAIIPFIKKVFKVKSTSLASFIAGSGIGFLLYVILGPIGIYLINKGSYSSYGEGGGLYTLADYLTNYTSLLVFVFIGATIFGGLVNRKTSKIVVERHKWFVPSAITAVLFLALGSVYMLIASIVDMTGFHGADSKTQIIEFCIMIVSLVISAIPNIYGLVQKKYKIKRIFPVEKREVIKEQTK